MSRYDYYKLDTPDRFEDEPRPALLGGPEDNPADEYEPTEEEWGEYVNHRLGAADPDDDADPVPQPDPADIDRFVDDGGAVADPPGGEG